MLRRDRNTDDFRAEIEAHIAIEADRLEGEGLSRGDAEAAARRTFGNVTQAEERFTEAQPLYWLQALWRDLRFAGRVLGRDASFVSTVVLTLAVCIAANVATFSIVNSVLLQPLPIEESGSILLMANRYPGAGAGDLNESSAADYYDRRRDLTVFEEQAAFDTYGETIEVDGTPRRVDSMAATPSLFRLLRVEPAIGRAFTDEEGEVGEHRKVILSHGLWQQLFAGERGVTGKELRLSGRPHEIVGIMPAGFQFVFPDVRLWTPLAFSAEEKQARHSNNWFNIGRLKAGATPAQAQSQVDALNEANLELAPQMRQLLIDAGFHTKVMPLQEMLVGEVEGILFLLWGGALAVLLIGALNVGNLALVRLTLRRREFATRRALGAGRMQILRQFLVENMVVALTGGALGLAAGAWLLGAIQEYGLEQIPRGGEVRLDSVVVAVTLVAVVLVALATTALPFVGTFRANLSRALRGARGGTGDARANRLQRAAVVSQIAFAFVLLVAAGILYRSVREILNVNPGFRTDGVLTFSLNAPGTAYPDGDDLRDLTGRALESLRSLPGVSEVGATTTIPLGDSYSDAVIFAEGYETEPGESIVSPRQLRVTPGYFKAMGVEVLRGRAFDARDVETAPAVVMVDERLAQRFWPDEDPIGKRMYQPSVDHDPTQVDENTEWLRVVGVVRSVHLDDLEGSRTGVGAYYFPLEQVPSGFVTFAVQGAGAPLERAPAVRRAMAEIDPSLALHDVRTMEERADLSLATKRTAMTLAAGYAGVALFLSAIGIYGLLAYYVAQRRRQFGIRVALGSTMGRIVKLVVREGFVLAGVGLGIGVAGVVALRDVLASEAFGVSTLDPWVIGGVTFVLGAVILVAAAVPARRACRVEPFRAINAE